MRLSTLGFNLAAALTAIFAALTLAACSESSEPHSTASAPQSPPASTAQSGSSSMSATEQSDSTPPSYGAQPAQSAKPDPSQTAQASDDALKPMTKHEESTTMPRPSQANDHSTLAPPKDGG